MFRKTPGFLFLAAAAIALAAASAIAAQQQIDQKDLAVIQRYRAAAPDLEKGQEFLVKGKLAQAEKMFRQVLETLPEHATAAYLLADCYAKQDRVDQGLEAIGQAEANFANFNRVLYRWQMSQINQFTSQKAALDEQIRALQARLIELKSDAGRQELQNQISALQSRLSAVSQRSKEGQLSESYTVPADYYYLHGNLLFKKKDYQASLDQYLKAVEIDPKHGNSYNNIANLYYMGRQYDKAREYLDLAETNGAKVNPAFKDALAKALKK